MPVVEIETSSEEDEEVVYMEEGDSDISEFDTELDEDRLPLITEKFKKLTRSPQEGDYVLVLLDSKKLKVYYVAKITEIIDANKYGVSFMRLKVKDNMKFYMPLEPNLSEIHIDEIKMILPQPLINKLCLSCPCDAKYEVALIYHNHLLILFWIFLVFINIFIFCKLKFILR